MGGSQMLTTLSQVLKTLAKKIRQGDDQTKTSLDRVGELVRNTPDLHPRLPKSKWLLYSLLLLLVGLAGFNIGALSLGDFSPNMLLELVSGETAQAEITAYLQAIHSQDRVAALDAKGDIFVSDFTRNDIQKFDSQGQFVLKWGGKGSEGGKLNHPNSIAVDTQGNVYVVDYGNSRIQKFDGEGKLLVAWGTQGSGSGQFSQPVTVTVDKAGSVLVLDSGNWRIQKFDTNGFFLASWVRFGKERFHARSWLPWPSYGLSDVSTESLRSILVLVSLRPQT